MLVFKRYDNEEASIGAQIALEHRLYVNKWLLRNMLKSIQKSPNGHCVCIAFNDNKAISVVARYFTDRLDGTTMAFTRKPYRRQGIASTLITETGLKVGSYSDGIKGSENFWLKIKSK